MTPIEYTTAEKQLISTLAWFRSRYALFAGFSLERKADSHNIEAFGEIWIGEFKEKWNDAFISLVRENILIITGDEYSFTDYGNIVKNQVDLETPFYKYEYDNYFQLEKRSRSHSIFCEEVYGLDLSQHGLINQSELSKLCQMIGISKPGKIVDIGCGNGKITEWISEHTKTPCTGIDISYQGIQTARERTWDNKLLKFEVGNLNNMQLSEKYDCVLFLDTLYYANSIKDTICQALELLEEGGHIYAYFSQWIMDESYKSNLDPDKTHLGNVLNELKLDYTFVNLSDSGKEHWKKKLEVLNILKDDFINEGSKDLWEYRHREAYRYANWGDEKYSRYLYDIKK